MATVPPSINSLLAAAVSRLSRAGCDTPRLDAELLLAHALGQDRTWIYTYADTALKVGQVAHFEQLLQRRERREPVAYLTGHKEFFGLDFQVNRQVLIPRPETELLVEIALALARPGCSLADVGTGSGCIAVTLAAHLPQAALFALDISPEALRLARQNAARHGLAHRITFLHGSLLQPLPHPVDFILSNPPYISPAEMAAPSFCPEVSRYEPLLALDGGPDGLDIIRRLLAEAGPKLKPGGVLLVEIGASQGQAVRQLAQAHFPAAIIRLKKDLAGQERLLVVTT